MERVNLETFAGGALQEKFDDALEQVLQNMMDPNTPYKNKRKIQVEVTFTQNEDRDDSSVDVAVITKLASVKPVNTRMAIGKDLRTGKCYAQEYGNSIRGQMSLEDFQPESTATVNGKEVDPETGEIKENVSHVVNFREAKQG